MAVFVDLARNHYGMRWLTKEDLRAYDLRECLDVDPAVISELICMTLDDDHTRRIPPMDGAVEVLTGLAKGGEALRFVTARVWPESIIRWLHRALPEVDPTQIQVFATGDPDAKIGVLRDLGVHYFVEDRLETCRLLRQQGIQPLLFDQPWNRTPGSEEFPRVSNWSQLGRWIAHQPPR